MGGLFSLLGVARDGIVAQTAALDVTGQNVAGANTPGFVKRTPILESIASGGVQVSGTARSFDRFTSAHPYANRASEWKQLYAPEGANKVRLVVTGAFEMEAGYDFLEVYSWKNNAWTLMKRYTGTVGPALTDELIGRYHYLRLVSDSSITKTGFDVAAEWAN